MAYTTLISAHELLDHYNDPDWVIVDCRFYFDDTELGRREYLEAHIPGAVYAHLNDDLSSPHVPGVTGRHPLPAVEDLAWTFSNWGIGPGTQVVAYDGWPASSGACAARLWWCLRWLGHDTVAVLDGGWQYWQLAGGASKAGAESRQPREFKPRVRPELVAGLEEVNQLHLDPSYRLFDSRSADRYRGENETIDPVAGRIPGALNAPYAENITSEGLFRPVDDLRRRFEGILSKIPAEKTVFYCGSGVTAAVNLLALSHAGLGDGRLYAGSWSEWIVDPHRPVATG
jgi:thiosulfate/3-mercaptopyruvate sulfurtransferase